MITQKLLLSYSHLYNEHKGVKGATYIFRTLRDIDLFRNLNIRRDYVELEFFGMAVRTVKPYDLYSLYAEMDTSKFVKDNSTGKVFYDIGAHHGVYSILGKEATEIYAFDIVDHNIDILEQNRELNDLDNFNIIQKAVHSHNGEITHENSIEGSNSTGRGSKIVDSIKLDDFVADNSPPDLVKIDVEGAEYQVLEGAREVLEEHRPTRVIEVHEEKMHSIYGDDKEQLFNLLSDLKYNLNRKAAKNQTRQIIARP